MTIISNQKCNLSQKPKLSSEDKPVKSRELQALTIAELDAISGARLSLNHNETIQRPKDAIAPVKCINSPTQPQ